MEHTRTEDFIVYLRENIVIEKTDGLFRFYVRGEPVSISEAYQPIMQRLTEGAASGAALEALLTAGGTPPLSARFTLAQFLIDCGDYIL